MNICSLVVHARPEVAGAVHTRLEEFPGVEVHGGAEEGKLIVTVEGGTDDGLADTMAAFNDVDGVINSILIYHYNGEDELGNEEVKQ
jgi:nitrate reductase NapD